MYFQKFLILIISALFILIIDQASYYFAGHKRSHFAYCLFKNCESHPFTPNPEVGFLIEPKKIKYLKRLSRTEDIEKHDNYNLNDYGFRVSKEYDVSKKRNINVYGDSFTFGLFLKDHEHVVSKLNETSKSCHFRNYGVPAFDFWQMIKLRHSKNLVLHAEFHLFLFITDDLMRITRPFEVHPIGRETTTFDLIRFMQAKGNHPLLEVPYFLLRNSLFFQLLYIHWDRKWWHSIYYEDVLSFFKKREYSNTRFIHIPSEYEYQTKDEGEVIFRPPRDLIKYSTEGFKNLKGASSYFFKGDGHPNALGADLIAKEVLKELKDICP